ncbi:MULTISPECIES: hypothetical protein [Pseudonocardia]|uniref:Uncharacterized protein n=2 Tax=Pseudonocardia TaxID=1847 RepID=A0A1Y2MIW1_PSEAH|nr:MULTISPECIES: hypothetical protein [Pseudonocardia]OSY34919.1 hypothetical protein BG845_06433 [Pseudonocardia autotrophica]TDN76982.1 hypothetical protein C8E95_6203 [Pseudonocardia autotrophica]BBG00986.1 hypothetical protein Pdca_21950 [Pseudonocardia autotrophica]GEC29127.1 hypothetical protein PSA01_61560 [Pseudonocardia saturnea]
MTVHASLLHPYDPSVGDSSVRDSSVRDSSVRDAVDRLTVEFAGHLPASLVEHVVRGSRDDLDSVPTLALPEMVERLARQRLIERGDQAEIHPATAPQRLAARS